MENENIDLFERYLQGKMEEAERRAFKQSLEEDEELQRQFSAFIMAGEAIEGELRADLKQKMQSWNEPKKGKSRGWSIVGLIVLILLGMAIASVIWVCPSQEEQNWEQYAAVNLQALERSGSPADDIRLLNQHYSSGNYAKAQQMIDTMPPAKRQKGEVQFIQGLLTYQETDYEDALPIFDILRKEEAVHFSISEQAEYYYVLTLIRKDDCTSTCVDILERIANDPKHLRQKEAKALLAEISL